ncbi:MAG: trypsin-like serine protease [Verrucomicrobiaceae bacterium]|nr:MAG: trypsin-like serine protease [Verrucomicrobiaceae bacterium]
MAELKAEDIYKSSLPSVMTLVVDKSNGSHSVGTGFLAIKDGIAVTAWHVVKGAKKVVAKFSSGEEFEVSGIVDKDEKRDIALVRVKTFGRPMLTTSPNEPPIGSKSLVLGAPRGLDFSISDGLVSQVQLIEGVKQFQFTCPASPGNSGGPLLNSRGEVLGVVSWQLRDSQNLNFAVPISYVLGLDSSLPTKPWEAVASGSASTAVAENKELDGLLIKAAAVSFDAESYNGFARLTIVAKKGGFKDGVPPYLYSLQTSLSEQNDLLSSQATADPIRQGALSALKKAIQTEQKALRLLIESIQSAQSSGGWTPRANDLLSQALAASSGQTASTSLDEFLKLPEVISRLPLGMKEAISPDTAGFKLGVGFPSADSLLLLIVAPKSFAERLGFRSGDRILSIDNKIPADLTEVKEAIKAALGKKLKAKVRRIDGKEQLLDLNVPKEVPSSS